MEGTTLSGADQQAMLDLFTHLDGGDTNALLAAIDSLPASVYNLVKPSIDMDTVVGIGLFLVALYAISYVLSAVQGWIMATITQRVSKEMRSDISHKINRLPMWYYNRTTTGGRSLPGDQRRGHHRPVPEPEHRRPALRRGPFLGSLVMMSSPTSG